MMDMYCAVCCRRAVYGRNEIVVPLRGIIALLFLEVLNPFYVFQFFSFILWFADNYIYYAVAILIMSAASIIMTIIQTRNVSRPSSLTCRFMQNTATLF